MIKPYYETANGVLYHGDCLEIMPELDPVDLVLTDPPYGTTRCDFDKIIPIKEMWDCLHKITIPQTAILLMAQLPFDKVLGSSNLKMLRYEWIWEKISGTGFLNANKMPIKAHENILVFYKKLPKYNPIKTTGHQRKTATKRLASSECYGENIKTTMYDSTERYPRDVLRFSSDKQRENLHPTQKPLLLMEYLIRTYTDVNDLVLDFSTGSGTVPVGCERLNRKWIGIEISEEYCEISARRIEIANKERRLPGF